jgi:hypothetical protein
MSHSRQVENTQMVEKELVEISSALEISTRKWLVRLEQQASVSTSSARNKKNHLRPLWISNCD